MIASPEQFVPLRRAGGRGLNGSNTCVPAYFFLFWDNCILQQVADAANACALTKRITAAASWQAETAHGCQAMQRRWKPVIPCELRR